MSPVKNRTGALQNAQETKKTRNALEFRQEPASSRSVQAVPAILDPVGGKSTLTNFYS